ncbi:Hypp6221 [Branchiostoma lanceolatum]|uniref:Hypp6221 protein n=1 Tax=Branchiostoma lanceolatum TaxID=7740 RepID=A0A8J9VIC4_BRALA|nr:Hypp6221 [Branchiostoma lanceolatum]
MECVRKDMKACGLTSVSPLDRAAWKRGVTTSRLLPTPVSGTPAAVKVSYFMAGHEDIDQLFSKIQSRLRKTNATAMDGLLQVIEQSYTPQPQVAEIDQQQMYDVKEWLDSEMLYMEHHNFPHTFMIERQDGENTSSSMRGILSRQPSRFRRFTLIQVFNLYTDQFEEYSMTDDQTEQIQDEHQARLKESYNGLHCDVILAINLNAHDCSISRTVLGEEYIKLKHVFEIRWLNMGEAIEEPPGSGCLHRGEGSRWGPHCHQATPAADKLPANGPPPPAWCILDVTNHLSRLFR